MFQYMNKSCFSQSIFFSRQAFVICTTFTSLTVGLLAVKNNTNSERFTFIHIVVGMTTSSIGVRDGGAVAPPILAVCRHEFGQRVDIIRAKHKK